MIKDNYNIIEEINKKLTEKYGEIEIQKLEYATDVYGYVDKFELLERQLVAQHNWHNDFRHVYKLEEDFYISIIVSEGATETQDTDDCVSIEEALNTIRRVYPKTINIIAYTE